MENLYGITQEELVQKLLKWKQPGYRAAQVFSWIQEKNVVQFDQMSNIPAELREHLATEYELSLPNMIQMQTSSDGNTRKALLQLDDSKTVETVLMQYRRATTRDRHTVCVSSQCGCAMKCPFCATGQKGLIRNLTAAEIVGQVIWMNKLIRETHPEEQVTNLVFMGMGEPLSNYDQVLKAIRLLGAPKGLNIGARRITVSTCGLVPGIRKLAREGLGLTLAVSLHSADNEIRDTLVPVNRTYPLEELMEACKEYFQETGRRITFEYALIKGENDRPKDAEKLGNLLQGINCQVNLIPLNPIDGSAYCRSGTGEEFARSLDKQGVKATIREEMGADINAACGQLCGTKKELE